MSKVAEAVAELARPVVEELGLILWDVDFRREHGERILRVVIDHPDGVSIGQCECVSRALDPLLDERDLIPDSYLFQVSSAGLERELKRPSDFQRFIGHPVELRLYAPRAGKREVTGRLAAYDVKTLTLEGEEPFDMSGVAQVRLKFEF